jgi:segregation and condensation protein B
MSHRDDDSQPSSAPTPESHGGSGGSARAPSPRHAPSEGTPQKAQSTVDIDRIQGVLEAILLAADEPLDRSTLATAFDDDNIETVHVERALERLELTYSGEGRGIHLTEVAGGFELRTNPAFHTEIRQLVEAKPVELSRAALETLAIIAYRQPLTRADIEEIRGVNSSGVLRTLQECELVEVVGRLDDLGRPHIYGTTDRFLSFFGFDDLTDLPTLSESEHAELEDLYDQELDTFDEAFEDGDPDEGPSDAEASS